ncbi:hypothetical protein GmHk_03G006744 [Glycine max]|nr:hypothetical protein GmHk_03G006744 [Glycine max]
MVAETEPFGSNKNGEKEEKWVVEICVPDRGSTHNRKGEVDVEGKDAAGLCVGPVTGDREGVEGECVVLVNGEGSLANRLVSMAGHLLPNTLPDIGRSRVLLLLVVQSLSPSQWGEVKLSILGVSIERLKSGEEV